MTQQFCATPEARALPAEELANFVPLGRVALIQVSALDVGLRRTMGLDQVPFPSLSDVILDEAMPALRELARSVSFRLDADEVDGRVLTYRGVDFLFADQEPLVTLDFVVFRPAVEDAGAGWPDVESPVTT